MRQSTGQERLAKQAPGRLQGAADCRPLNPLEPTHLIHLFTLYPSALPPVT